MFMKRDCLQQSLFMILNEISDYINSDSSGL